MRILILGFTKIKYMPYMHFYLDQIDKTKNEIHLIFWDRDGTRDVSIDDRIILHCFKRNMSDALPLKQKMPSIIAYGKYAKKTINNINPDYLIVLHSTTALTIIGNLLGKYKNKYIFDYRDITYERFYIYRKLISDIVLSSTLTFISSDGFRIFLPNVNDKMITSHNLLKSSLLKREEYKDREHDTSKTIRIAFWGMIRHLSINERIVDILGNDKRFEIHYYGRASSKWIEFFDKCKINYNNVFYHGEYLPEDRNEFAKKTDLIHNLYSNNDATTPYAMGNKFYDGLIFYIPQLCTDGSFMGDMCNKYGVGLSCNLDDNDLADKIYEFYQTLDYKSFNSKCDFLLNNILSQIDDGEEKIRRIFHE